MGMEYKGSAFKHGLTELEIAYVVSHAVDRSQFVDRFGDQAFRFIGPLHDQTDRLAEVFIKQSGKTYVIFHAMETGERTQ